MKRWSRSRDVTESKGEGFFATGQLTSGKMSFFSDECRFGLKNDCKTFTVWRRSDEASNADFFQFTVKNSVSVIFWGLIGPNGVGRLVRCHGQINAVKTSRFCRTTFTSLQKKCLEKKIGHSPFNMIMHPHIVPKRPRFIQNCMAFMCLRGLQTFLTLTLSKMFGFSLKTN